MYDPSHAVFISAKRARTVAQLFKGSVVRPHLERGELQGYKVFVSGMPLTNGEVESYEAATAALRLV